MKNQRGQALIEYVALLFVGILMVLGLVYQFNDAFRQYLDAWFNSDESGYLFCLIQNGYLPGESGTCSPPQFNLKNGKVKSSIGGTSNANGSAQGGGNGGAGANHSLSGSSPSGGEGGGGLRGLVPVGANFGGKGKGAGAGGVKESTGNADGSSSSPAFNGGNSAGAGSRNRDRGRYIPIKTDDSDGGAVAAKTIPVTDNDLRPQSRYVAATKAKKKEQEDSDFNSNFTVGKILKFIIIIFILFSIFFFIGSQLLAISQGGKKRR